MKLHLLYYVKGGIIGADHFDADNENKNTSSSIFQKFLYAILWKNMGKTYMNAHTMCVTYIMYLYD